MPDYSALDRLLHRLALGSPVLAEAMHDLERGAFLKSAPEDHGNHVFIAGLARSGTTVLMREIHETGQFGSLTYADMPFVLAPNLWAQLAKRGQKSGRKTERAHGDGIEVDNHSPEALDEVYWRVFDGKAYIRPEVLLPHKPGDDLVAGYRDLIRLVLRKTDKARYVSKNNNNILRIGSLAAAMPDAQFLIPVRHPLDQAASLLAQHERFQTASRFTRDYMIWLGHHEFGPTHLPFRFGGMPQGKPESMDYWLQVWLSVYRALDQLEAAAKNMVFVPFEKLNTDPTVWQAIAARIGVLAGPALEIRPVRGKAPGAHDPVLLAEAEATYSRLSKRGLQKLGLDA